MDSSVQLVDVNAFGAYLTKIKASMQIKLNRLQSFAGDDWFDRIKAREEGSEFDRRGNVAVISIKGYLSYGYSFWTWLMDGCSYCGLIAKINAAMNDQSITKIVLDVNSPGGGTIGCIEASNAIFAARKVKDVVAVVNPEAASAGYWLASQAAKIVVLESGFVGSVGAEIDYQSFHGYMKELGIDVAIIRSAVSPDKNLGHQLEPISDRAKEYFQGLCDYAAANFIEHVARGRNVKESVVTTTYGKGRMFFGKQAVDIGMADGIGDLASEVNASTDGRSAARVGNSIRPRGRGEKVRMV